MTKTLGSRSLLRQAIAVVIAAQLLCATLFCAGALLHERHVHRRTFDISLQGRSDSLLGAIQDAEDPDDNVMIDPVELKLPADDVYAVYNQGGQLLGSSPAAPAELIERRGDGFHEVTVGHASYRVLQREAMRVIDRAENDGIGLKRPVTIVYAASERHVWHAIFEAVRFYLVAIVLATGASAILVMVLLRRALEPLAELAAAAGRLTPPALAFDAPVAALQVRELCPLAEVLTDTAGRLREAFAREQRFVSDAAHELKTAIAVVRSSVQLLMLKRRSPDEYASGLERVLADNARVEALVAQMLQGARAGEMGKEAAVADLSSLVAEALRQLAPVAAEAGVYLSFEGGSSMLVRLDPESGLTLISNLVMNAIQHSRAGQAVTVLLAGKIGMEVRDAGEGIAADALPHVFERFFRVDRSRSRATGGTGLGLSICQSIAEAAGGTIRIESSPGAGTRVLVTFIAA